MTAMTAERGSTVLLLLLVAELLTQLAAGQEGWRMVDRFYGFRYEISPNGAVEATMKEIQDKADTLGCFGWVQENTARKSLVGEVRCAKTRGPVMQEYLQKEVGSAETGQFLVYPDTKIRLHFSHFKIVEPQRDTCFLDMPHKCPDLQSADESSPPSSTSSAASSGASAPGKDEL